MAIDRAKTTEIQILGLNDFHGAILPPTGSGGRLGRTGTPEFGGVEYPRDARAGTACDQPDNTLFVSAGDLIGATPLISALFHDEPTIEAFNLMELDYNGVGNHEFDEGVDELLRMQNGGCHPVDGCQDGDRRSPARSFDFLAANVTYKDNGRDDLPALRDPQVQGREGRHRRHDDRGDADDRHAGRASPTSTSSTRPTRSTRSCRELKKQDVETIVVLLHEGGPTSTAGNGTGAGADRINDCANRPAACLRSSSAMDDEIDVVVTGHTNWAVNCVIDGKIVTGAGANGRHRHGHRPDHQPRVEGRRRRDGEQRRGLARTSRRRPT